MKKIFKSVFKLLLVVLCAFLFQACQMSDWTKADMVWKFEQFESLNYQYEQEMKVSPAEGLLAAFGLSNTAKADLELITNEDNTADIKLKNVELGLLESLIQNGDKQQDIPEFLVKGIRPDGSLSEQNGEISKQLELLYLGLFPLPQKDLEVGESTQMPINLSLKPLGTDKTLIGMQTLKLEKANGNQYTLVSTILLEEKDTNNQTGERPHQIEGEGKYIFDVEKGYFLEGKVELEIFTKLKNQKARPRNIPFDISKMNLRIKSTAKFRLQENEQSI